MKAQRFLVALLCVVAVPAAARAQYTWCYTTGLTYPDTIFCDDFERYCGSPPPYPQPCPYENGFLMGVFRSTWAHTIGCTELWPDEQMYQSPPWAVRYPCQGDAQLGQNTTDLSDDITNRYSYANGILGRDENPLVLEFVLNGQTVRSKIIHANAYMDLCMNNDRAPTNYVMSAGPCGAASKVEAWDVGGPYPIVAQQEFPPADAPPIASAPVRASIAVGCLAFLDHNPCDSDQQSPENYHLAFFNGRIWYSLRQGLFPGSGDFQLYDGANFVRMTIKTTSVIVEMTATKPNPDQYSWCEVPREYLDKFNTLRAGFGQACQINSSSWVNCCCDSRMKCIRGAYGAGAPGFDNVVLRGGVPAGPPSFTQNPQPQVACVGGTATFSVVVAGVPPITYQWQKNLMNLIEGSHYVGTKTPTLTINGVNTGDAGNYTCIATNSYGMSYSLQAALTVATSVSPVPADGAPISGGVDRITWKWTDVSGESGYRVRDLEGVNRSGNVAANATQWEETGLSANTAYTRKVSSYNGCGESAGSSGQTRWTLSAPPVSGTVVPSDTSPCAGRLVTWTALAGFGPGTVQYYRYAWDQSASHAWNGAEPIWSSGTIQTVPTSGGTWYLHVRGYNGEDVANGTYDYALTTRESSLADLDGDCDVDGGDFGILAGCFNGTGSVVSGLCLSADLNGDQYVDGVDYGLFAACFNGSGNPPACG